MKFVNTKLLMIPLMILLGGCASNEIEKELVYCPWSQDGSRWPVHKTNTRTYFIAAALGANESAYNELTGGVPKLERKRDIEGHIIHVQSNSFGIVLAFDTFSNCYLTPLAYGVRKVGR